MEFFFFRYNKVTKRFVFIFTNAFKNFYLKYHLDLLSHNLSKYLSHFPTDWLPFFTLSTLKYFLQKLQYTTLQLCSMGFKQLI